MSMDVLFKRRYRVTLILTISILSIIPFSSSKSIYELRNATRVDLTYCKFTQLGVEYKGPIATTTGGIRCQAWAAEKPLHKVSEDIKDSDFPEKSMKMAQNYCRNPTRSEKGPWCYTLEQSLIDDDCDVKLCNFGECKVTGIGAEYGGTRKISLSGRQCKSWDKKYKLADSKTVKFPEKKFPDDTREDAHNFCRNPDDSTGGPWCYVEQEGFVTVEKEYCDVPFCNDKDCLVYTKNASAYTTISGMNSTYGNVSFWMKLWSPYDEQYGEARILLSLLPVPSSATKIAQDWRSGVEIVLRNNGSGQSYPTSDEDEQILEDSPDILLSSKWTGIWITWGGGFISLGLHGSSKPFIMDEYKKKKTISALYPDSFLYYGLMGTGVMWSSEFCETSCEAHTTFGSDFLRLWPLQQNNDTYDIQFHVRASSDILLRLYQNPGVAFPYFTIEIGNDNVLSLTYQATEESLKQFLQEIPSKGLLDFWIWKEFSISIFGPHLRLFSKRIYGNEEMLYENNYLFTTIRWFSVGSEQTIAQWTFFCDPDKEDAVEDPWPPDCISDLTDFEYQGSQWTSAEEIPCIPWLSAEVPEEEKADAKFVDGSALKAINKCRNPSHDPLGPYCYAVSSADASDVNKQYCPIRSCRSSECRMAGTANDYIGTLFTTRSGRTCAKWVSDYDYFLMKSHKGGEKNQTKEPPQVASIGATRRTPKRTRANLGKRHPLAAQEQLLTYESKSTTDSTMVTEEDDIEVDEEETLDTGSLMMPVHAVNHAYFNDSLYPEQSARNASNYCRNPSRNIGGTWCYTTDPKVQHDLCNVRDCEKPDECTFLVKGHGIGRRIYVMPEHRTEGLLFSLKAWEPDQPDSITFVFTADDGMKSRYILKVGAVDNERVLLYYESENEALKLVKKKTLPHLLFMGKWSSFVIRVPRGRVLVHYEGAPNPLFEWEHPEPLKGFSPIYYYYNSEQGRAIGVAFDCTSRCHVEITETDRHTRILPISTWTKQEVVRPDRLVLMIRAKGVVLVPLFLLPATPGYYALSLGESNDGIYFMKNMYPKVRIFHKQRTPRPIFTTDSWTNITIKWKESTIDVIWNDTEVLHYVHDSPLLFYYFSLSVDPGSWATWTANCVPPDIDGPPLDGGWSEWGPWACSASCDGGTGIRKRVCNAPEPNVKGEPCMGPSIVSGPCNMIKCGDINEDAETLIKRRIMRNYTALFVEEGKSVTIPSDPDVIQLITAESPNPDIQWSLNGIFIREVKDRIEIKDYNVEIRKAILNDSGVYTVTLRRVDESYMVFKVVTLAVLPNRESLTIRETLSITLLCQCVILGYLYADLKVSWTIEDEVWKDYGITLPIAVNVDHVPAVNKSHEGMWKCVVEQSDFGFRWTTNVILVKGPPNWRTHLMEDKLTRPIFGWMPSEAFVEVAALVLFLLIIGCIIVCCIVFIRFRESLSIQAPARKVRIDPEALRHKRRRPRKAIKDDEVTLFPFEEAKAPTIVDEEEKVKEDEKKLGGKDEEKRENEDEKKLENKDEKKSEIKDEKKPGVEDETKLETEDERKPKEKMKKLKKEEKTLGNVDEQKLKNEDERKPEKRHEKKPEKEESMKHKPRTPKETYTPLTKKIAALFSINKNKSAEEEPLIPPEKSVPDKSDETVAKPAAIHKTTLLTEKAVEEPIMEPTEKGPEKLALNSTEKPTKTQELSKSPTVVLPKPAKPIPVTTTQPKLRAVLFDKMRLKASSARKIERTQEKLSETEAGLSKMSQTEPDLLEISQTEADIPSRSTAVRFAEPIPSLSEVESIVSQPSKKMKLEQEHSLDEGARRLPLEMEKSSSEDSLSETPYKQQPWRLRQQIEEETSFEAETSEMESPDRIPQFCDRRWCPRGRRTISTVYERPEERRLISETDTDDETES